MSEADILRAAINYTCEVVRDVEWLTAWCYGDPDAMRELEDYMAGAQ